MLVANAATAFVYLLARGMLNEAAATAGTPVIPSWAGIVLSLGAVLNFICAIALFKWKKWGFFGFVASALLALGVNMAIGLGIGQSLFGLVGVAVLYGVLQIGGDRKGWTQLE